MLTLRQQLAMKVEANAGTAVSLAAADVIRHIGAEFEADIPMTELEGASASLSKFGSVPGARKGTVRFKQRLAGTVGAPVAISNEPWWSKPWQCMGFALSVSGTTPAEQCSFKPSSTTINDETSGAFYTIGVFQDGMLFQIHGAVGSRMSLTFENGNPVLAEYEFVGVYDAPVDAALLVPSYPALVEPTFNYAALSVLSYTTAKIKSLKIEVANTVAMRPYPNATTGAGYFSAQITDRKITGSFDAELTSVATKNWFNEWIAGTTGSITTGLFPSAGANYNMLNCIIPKAAYTKVGVIDREGMAAVDVAFEARRNSDAGDDEMEMIQS